MEGFVIFPCDGFGQMLDSWIDLPVLWCHMDSERWSKKYDLNKYNKLSLWKATLTLKKSS